MPGMLEMAWRVTDCKANEITPLWLKMINLSNASLLHYKLKVGSMFLLKLNFSKLKCSLNDFTANTFVLSVASNTGMLLKLEKHNWNTMRYSRTQRKEWNLQKRDCRNNKLIYDQLLTMKPKFLSKVRFLKENILPSNLKFGYEMSGQFEWRVYSVV